MKPHGCNHSHFPGIECSLVKSVSVEGKPASKTYPSAFPTGSIMVEHACHSRVSELQGVCVPARGLFTFPKEEDLRLPSSGQSDKPMV